jgi:hypothetical protein
MRSYTFDLKCPRCDHSAILTLPGPPPVLICPQCNDAELRIIRVHIGLDADPNDSVNVFHHVNDQRSNLYERSERPFRNETTSVRPEPAE